MEIVGGFMMMVSIIGFFLAVVWLIMPFVVLAIKGRQDKTLDVLDATGNRLAAIEQRLHSIEAALKNIGATVDARTSGQDKKEHSDVT